MATRNYILSKILILSYSKLGIRDAFISPGSRNTPLVLALSDQTKIKVIKGISVYQNQSNESICSKVHQTIIQILIEGDQNSIN